MAARGKAAGVINVAFSNAVKESLRKWTDPMEKGQVSLVDSFVSAFMVDVKEFLLNYAPSTEGTVVSVSRRSEFMEFKAFAFTAIRDFLCLTVLASEPSPASYAALTTVMAKRVNLDSRWSTMLVQFVKEAGARRQVLVLSPERSYRVHSPLQVIVASKRAPPRRLVSAVHLLQRLAGALELQRLVGALQPLRRLVSPTSKPRRARVHRRMSHSVRPTTEVRQTTLLCV